MLAREYQRSCGPKENWSQIGRMAVDLTPTGKPRGTSMDRCATRTKSNGVGTTMKKNEPPLLAAIVEHLSQLQENQIIGAFSIYQRW